MYDKRKLALLYRIIIVIVSSIALFVNFKLMTFRLGILYFTNLSNLFCLLYFLVLVIEMILGKDKENSLHYIVKGMVTMCITLTMVVYNFILAGDSGIFKNHMLECNLVHLVVPIMVIFDYILFGKKGNLKKEYVIYWCLGLFGYQVFVMIYSLLGGTFIGGASYPYFHMNTEKYGVFGVFINTLVILIIYVLYGLLIQKLDNLVGNRKNNKLEDDDLNNKDEEII